MKTRLNSGFSSSSHSRNSSNLHAVSCRTRQNQGRKFDGTSGVRSQRTRRIAAALLAPSIYSYRLPLAFSTYTGRREADICFCVQSRVQHCRACPLGRALRGARVKYTWFVDEAASYIGAIAQFKGDRASWILFPRH
jgi:hypothetical protein